MCRCILGWSSVTHHFQVPVTLYSDLFFLIIVSEAYLSYLLRYNPKFGVCMHLGMKQCNVPSLGHCDLDLWPSLKNWHWVWCISPILFEVGITNLVCESIFGWWCVTYHLWVTVTLTSVLVFRIIMSWHITCIFWNMNPKFGVWVHLWMVECRVLFIGYCDLDFWPSL